MPVITSFRPLAVAVVAGGLSMGALSACSTAEGATPDLAAVGTTAGPEPGGAPGVIPLGAPAPGTTPQNAPPLWPGAATGPDAGGAPREVPRLGIATGGGSTAGVEDLGLVGAGAASLAGAGALALVAQRRRGQA